MIVACPRCKYRIDLRHGQATFWCACGAEISAGGDVLTPPLEPVTSWPSPIDYSTCIHRGDELRQQECQSCKGLVKVKVFSCSEFKECTIGKVLPEIQCCSQCPAFESPTGLKHQITES